MLIFADNALKSADRARKTSRRLDRRAENFFRGAIYQLSRFEKDFRSSSKDSDGNRTVTREAKMINKSKSILDAFSSHDAKVKFPSVPLPLNADES